MAEEKKSKSEGLKRGRLSASEKEEIEKLHKMGRKISTIATKMNRSEEAIRKTLNIKDEEPVGAGA